MLLLLQDINRLAVMTNCHLVMYYQQQKTSAADQQPSSVRVLRDFRQNFVASTVRYFLFKKNQQTNWVSLHEAAGPLDNWCEEENYFLASPNTCVKYNQSDILPSLLQVCRKQQESETSSSSSSNCNILPIVNNLNLLACHNDLMVKELNAVSRPVLVVGYRGIKGKLPSGKKYSRGMSTVVQAKKCIFQTVALLAPPDLKMSMASLNLKNNDSVTVVCSFGLNNFCLLSHEFREALLSELTTNKPNDDILKDCVEQLEVGANQANPFAQPKSENVSKRQKKIEKRKRKMRWDKIKKLCRCDNCSGAVATDYDDNMSRGGPEQLITHKLSITQLLKMLGAYDAETAVVLEELSRLSVAAFDIESMTQKLHHSAPDSILPYADIDNCGQAQHNVAVQKPIMLAHRDGMMQDDELCPVFVIESDDEASVYKMMRSYWKFVAQRQQQCETRKKFLADNLNELILKYKFAFFEHADRWVDPTTNSVNSSCFTTKDLKTGWKFSVPGLLETQLDMLISRYEIFSFYGSGYDHVLLQNYLVPYLFEKRLRPKVEKRGNKINVIKVPRCHVTFRDVISLLSPGTSLRQFGQLFNLQQAKAHFPFGILTGVDALKLPKLPADVSDWQSDLTASKGPTTQADVDEALQLFEDAQCNSVGDYLTTYLRLDVDILYLATQGWRQTIAAEINVDFVHSATFTISSISNYAGDVNASANLFVGQFFPNSSSVYRLLRKGMRG